MSSFNDHYPQDLKASNTPLGKPDDVEQGSPPAYPLAEPEELVVGGSRPRCRGWRFFRRKSHCGAHAERCQGIQKRRKLLRFFKWLFATWVLLTLVHFVVAGVRFHKALKTLKCVTITPAAAADGLEFTVPLAHSSSHVVVHDSLTGGDTYVTHDATVANGTVELTVNFSEGGKDDAVYDGCMLQVNYGTAVALIPRERHGSRAKIASFALRFPDSVVAPAVKLMGKGDKHISDRKLRKLIRWWRKHHDKKDLGLVAGKA